MGSELVASFHMKSHVQELLLQRAWKDGRCQESGWQRLYAELAVLEVIGQQAWKWERMVE
jgi:hypothetical protein